MQLVKAEVTPVELSLRKPIRLVSKSAISQVTAIFIRLETQDGLNAWGCTIAHPDLNGEEPARVIQACQACAAQIPDLHPTNLEFSLAALTSTAQGSPAALCAYDLAFYDLLGLAAGMPLYRLLGGYRNKIPTSVTIPAVSLEDSVGLACANAARGFRMLKIKGGLDADLDVQRVRAIHRALPELELRLDADGSYTHQEALDIARALKGKLQFFEQPTPAENLKGLTALAKDSPIPIIADQSVRGPDSALALATLHRVPGLSIKLVTCGGFGQARLVDAIARAARMFTMISCLIEPALLIAGGLALALSSPSVQYCDLDGHLDLIDDPTQGGFSLKDGCLKASEIPGLGCSVALT